MSTIDTTYRSNLITMLQRIAEPLLERIVSLPEDASRDCVELLGEYRRTKDEAERHELLRALVEVAMDEPVDVVPVGQLEEDGASTLLGAAASDRMKREALTFARNLKRLRRQQELTQKRLAEAAGTTQPQISYLERGEHRPQENTVKRLAEALGVETDELLALSE